MIIKVSFLAAATIAAYAVSHKNSNSTRKKQLYTAIQPPEKEDSNFQQKQNEGEMEEEEAAETLTSEELNSSTEIELLHNLVKELQQRKVRLERKLLELCGLKEEKSYIAHLQKHLEDKSAEIEMLNATIASLQAERKILQEDVKQCVLAKKQLEMAKKMIEDMQKKIMDANERNMNMKGRLLMVEEQVSSFPKDHEASARDAIVEKKLKAVEIVELEVLKMKRRNKELQLEKRELKVKLVSAQARISTLSTMTEGESIARVEEEISRLRHTNEDLSRQVERLQKNRFDMVQELVYQRWLYACLRFETQIHSSPSREALKHDHLTKKIEPLISNPSYESPSSHSSSTALSDEIENTTIDSSSSSSQRSSSKFMKPGFMQSIKRWARSKDGDAHGSSLTDRSNGLSKRGLVRRFSTSMVPLKTSILRKNGDSATSSSRGRRVSFSDSVKSTDEYSSKPKSVDQRVLDDKEIMIADDDHKPDFCSSTMTTMNSTQIYNNIELEGETHDHNEPASSPEVHASPKFINIVAPEAEENKVDTNVVGFVAALFLLFILVACLKYNSAS